MSKKPKGIARAAKERRRAEAEDRNARTPDDRRRAAREGSVAYRARLADMWQPAKPWQTPGQLVPGEGDVTLEPLALGQRNSVSEFRPARPAGERGPAITPRSKHIPQPRRRPAARATHIAPRQIGDGLKPNHRARAVDIGDLFPRTDLLDALTTAAAAAQKAAER